MWNASEKSNFTATCVFHKKKVLKLRILLLHTSWYLNPHSNKTTQTFCLEAWFQEYLKQLKNPGKAQHLMSLHKCGWNHHRILTFSFHFLVSWINLWSIGEHGQSHFLKDLYLWAQDRVWCQSPSWCIPASQTAMTKRRLVKADYEERWFIN